MSEILVQNPFKFHKFWASKPLNIALQYLDEHAGNRKVLLDPFAGSGVFIYAGLLKGLKAIYNDADPFALFLARNTIKPVDIEKLQDAYVHFLTRSIDRDITAGDKVIIPKGSTVEYIIKWFYESKCNVCGSPVEVDYYIWDTEYEIAENDLKKISRDPRTSIFLSICRKKEDKWVFSQKDVTEKWRELVDKNPTVWLEKSKKKKIAASLVTLFSSQLVARNIAKRTQRKPVYKKFVCPNNPDHSRKPQPISEVDLEKIKLIERLDYPFPIPETELTYDINGKKVPFLTYKIRPRDIIYSKDEYEYLNTVSDKDFLYKEGSLIFLPKVKHYFTKRNLILASILFWSAIQEYDLELKEQLLLLFTSILHKLTKLESETQRWGANCYFILPNYVERNPLYVLSRSNRPYYSAFLDAKKSVNSLGDKFKETWDVDEFINSIFEKSEKPYTVLWLCRDAATIDEIFGRYKRFIDLIFTDPPYVGEKRAIYYYELTTLYNAWLSLWPEYKRYGDTLWWKYEITDDKQQMKSLDDYFLNLEKALKAVDRIVTDNGLWIVTYHSASKRVWEGVRKCFFSIGLKPPDYEEIMSHEIRAVGGSFIAHRYGSIGKDAYIVMEKAPTRITPKIINEHDFVAEVVRRMKRDLQRTKGLVSWNMFSAHYPHVVWKIGAPPIEGGNDSYKKLFEKYTFPLTSEWRIFDRDKIGDEVWKEVYDAIPAEKLLTNCMRLFAEGKGRKIKREELVYGLLQKIDGRIDDRLISEVLERNFTYDLAEEVYVLHEIKGPMDIFLPKPGTFPSPAKYEAAPPPPEKVIFRYAETAKMFGHKILYKKAQRSARGLSATEALFDLIIETSKGRIYISVNDTTPVKQAAYYWSEAERLNRPIVFIYYGKKVDEIREAANKITVYAIIYDKWEEVERALKAANPLEKLEVYRLGN